MKATILGWHKERIKMNGGTPTFPLYFIDDHGCIIVWLPNGEVETLPREDRKVA